MNRSFDVLDERRAALVVSDLMPVVPADVLVLHLDASIAVHLGDHTNPAATITLNPTTGRSR